MHSGKTRSSSLEVIVPLKCPDPTNNLFSIQLLTRGLPSPCHSSSIAAVPWTTFSGRSSGRLWGRPKPNVGKENFSKVCPPPLSFPLSCSLWSVTWWDWISKPRLTRFCVKAFVRCPSLPSRLSELLLRSYKLNLQFLLSPSVLWHHNYAMHFLWQDQ